VSVTDPFHGTRVVEDSGNGRVNDDEPRWRRAHRLAEQPAQCFKCDAPLAPDAEVWRVRIGLGYSTFGWHGAIVPFCADCGCESVRYEPRYFKRSPRPCEGCGRPVVDTERRARTVTACGEEGRARVYGSRRQVEREPRECAECGERFMPSRSDAVFCGAACKQRDYRRRKRDRVTALECSRAVRSDSGNAGEGAPPA